MSCDGTDSVSVINSTSKRLKNGRIRKYKDQVFGSKWPESYAVLYQDSTFIWYNREGDSSPKGCVQLSRLAPYIVVGAYTDRLPNRPSLPEGGRIQNMIAIGSPDRSAKINWFLCSSDDSLNEWMSQIVSTLPPPPQPPQQQQQLPPPPINPAYAYGNNPPQVGPRPMGNPVYPSGQPVVYAYQPQAAPQATHTTVIVDGNRGGYNNGGYYGGGGVGLGTGLLVGGVAGYALGSMTSHHGYGGYGYGYGYGGGYGGGFYEDNDTTIVNNYNVTNFNDNDVTNNTYDTNVTNDYDNYDNDNYNNYGGDDYSGYDGGDDGGGGYD